jgi:hypothetical protein
LFVGDRGFCDSSLVGWEKPYGHKSCPEET